MPNRPKESYPRPSVTVDAIVFTIRQEKLQVALVNRGVEPYKGTWAIPGGFVRMDESLEAAAKRELQEEVGVENVYLEQLYTFGDPGRDPRERVITVAYFALAASNTMEELVATTDANDARWFPLDNLPPLAFDHAKILALAMERLRAKLQYSTIAYALLPTKFRLTQLQETYEIILGRTLDKRNFRKKILASGLLEETNERSHGAHRPATLYQFKNREVTIF